MINAPKMAWRHFSEVTNDKFDTREAVEDPIRAHSQDMALHILPEL